mgnify:CR=1 FL=1
MFKKYYFKLKEHISKAAEKISQKNELKREYVKKESEDYFEQARSWADDLYTCVVASRNRYRFFLYISLGFVCLLMMCIAMLIPSQHIEPLIIHQYDDGRVSVERMHSHYTPSSVAEVKSDLVRYVVTRESYDAIGYDHQYRLTSLLSSPQVSRGYAKDQSVRARGRPPVSPRRASSAPLWASEEIGASELFSSWLSTRMTRFQVATSARAISRVMRRISRRRCGWPCSRKLRVL